MYLKYVGLAVIVSVAIVTIWIIAKALRRKILVYTRDDFLLRARDSDLPKVWVISVVKCIGRDHEDGAMIQVLVESILRFSDRDVVLKEWDELKLVPAGSYRQDLEELRRKSGDIAKEIAQGWSRDLPHANIKVS